jgi:hypothetical protein
MLEEEAREIAHERSANSDMDIRQKPIHQYTERVQVVEVMTFQVFLCVCPRLLLMLRAAGAVVRVLKAPRRKKHNKYVICLVVALYGTWLITSRLWSTLR